MPGDDEEEDDDDDEAQGPLPPRNQIKQKPSRCHKACPALNIMHAMMLPEP